MLQMKLRKVLIGLICGAVFSASTGLWAQFDEADDFGPASAFSAFDIKAGIIKGLDEDNEGFGFNTSLSLISGISPYIAWGLTGDYSYTTFVQSTGKYYTTQTGKKLKVEKEIYGHSADVSAQLGLTVPLNPVHFFLMVGPAFSYYGEQTQEDTTLGIDASDINFSGLTGLARAGIAYHLDSSTGLVGEVQYRFGRIQDQTDGSSLSITHTALAFRAGFRFIY